jgi:fructokinase
LQKFVSVNASETLKFYDINLRPGCFNRDIITKSLAKADILKLSVEELAELKRMLSVNEEQEAFVRYLIEEYALNTVSLTKGSAGSELFTSRGSSFASTAEAVKVIDSVGAGDAYAAMMAAGILKKWQPPEILRQAARFASRVCEIKGAIPESASFYEPFRPLFMQ